METENSGSRWHQNIKPLISANDQVILMEDNLQEAVHELRALSARYDLNTSLAKTKVMVFPPRSYTNTYTIKVQQVSYFQYMDFVSVLAKNLKGKVR